MRKEGKMANQKEPRVKLPPVSQIGIVVRDMDKAIEYYSSTFGWGPFKVSDVEVEDIIFRGSAVRSRTRLGFTSIGPITIELIQVLEGETLHTEFLREKGEGIQHLRFEVDDLDSALCELAQDGIHPVFHQELPEFGLSFAYLDTDRIGGVMFELVEIAESHKRWWR